MSAEFGPNAVAEVGQHRAKLDHIRPEQCRLRAEKVEIGTSLVEVGPIARGFPSRLVSKNMPATYINATMQEPACRTSAGLGPRLFSRG